MNRIAGALLLKIFTHQPGKVGAMSRYPLSLPAAAILSALNPLLNQFKPGLPLSGGKPQIRYPNPCQGDQLLLQQGSKRDAFSTLPTHLTLHPITGGLVEVSSGLDKGEVFRSPVGPCDHPHHHTDKKEGIGRNIHWGGAR